MKAKKEHIHKWKKTGNKKEQTIDKFLTIIIAEEKCSICGKKRNTRIIGAIRNGTVIMGTNL